MNKTLEIQKRLSDLGYDPGPIDGIRGRLTIAAIKRFQADKGLTVDGIVGPKTSAELFATNLSSAKPTPPAVIQGAPWMDQAYHVKGLHERNPRIKEWLKSDGSTVGDPAEIPWCGDFVQTAIALTLDNEPIPTNPYLAANWTKFGVECTPQYGAVLVFWRGSPSSWKGHVGFYVGETATEYHVLGGNQSNAVTETFISKSRLRTGGIRWPKTVFNPNGRPILVDRKGRPISTNEA